LHVAFNNKVSLSQCWNK